MRCLALLLAVLAGCNEGRPPAGELDGPCLPNGR